jgi:hypothetical protein
MTRKTKKQLDKIAFTGAVLALGGFLAWFISTLPR